MSKKRYNPYEPFDKFTLSAEAGESLERLGAMLMLWYYIQHPEELQTAVDHMTNIVRVLQGQEPTSSAGEQGERPTPRG